MWREIQDYDSVLSNIVTKFDWYLCRGEHVCQVLSYIQKYGLLELHILLLHWFLFCMRFKCRVLNFHLKTAAAAY